MGCLYGVVNYTLRFLRVMLWPRTRPTDPQRICIYRNGFIGDTVCALPAMYAIRKAYPRAHITLMTSPVEGKFPGAKELLGNSELFEEIYVYFRAEVVGLRNRVRFLKSLRQRHFDIWIELPQDLSGPFNQLRNMIVARLSGA
jgi:ADP-heptose:LPS heptosyltransferase